MICFLLKECAPDTVLLGIIDAMAGRADPAAKPWRSLAFWPGKSARLAGCDLASLVTWRGARGRRYLMDFTARLAAANCARSATVWRASRVPGPSARGRIQ